MPESLKMSPKRGKVFNFNRGRRTLQMQKRVTERPIIAALKEHEPLKRTIIDFGANWQGKASERRTWPSGAGTLSRFATGESGIKAKGRKICGKDEESGLRESHASCGNDFEADNGPPSTRSVRFWKTNL
jgi:hypothetical protein